MPLLRADPRQRRVRSPGSTVVNTSASACSYILPVTSPAPPPTHDPSHHAQDALTRLRAWRGHPGPVPPGAASPAAGVRREVTRPRCPSPTPCDRTPRPGRTGHDPVWPVSVFSSMEAPRASAARPTPSPDRPTRMSEFPSPDRLLIVDEDRPPGEIEPLLKEVGPEHLLEPQRRVATPGPGGVRFDQ
jgi:hypothetical protein